MECVSSKRDAELETSVSAICPAPSTTGRAPGHLPGGHGKSQGDQERLSDLIGPYWGTYGMVYRVLQPVLGFASEKYLLDCPKNPLPGNT